MKIVFDHQIFLQNFGGISRYYVRLGEELAKLGIEVHFIAPFYRNKYLRHAKGVQIHGTPMPSLPKRMGRFLRSANKILSPFKINAISPDVIHETYYQARGGDYKNSPLIVTTVYDMIHEKLLFEKKNSQKTINQKRESVNRAFHIICISETTREDLCKILEVHPNRTSTIHLGVDSYSVPATFERQKDNSKKYLLFVGSRGSYKNFDRLAESFSKSERLTREFTLVTFGGTPFSVAEIQRFKGFGLSEHQVVNLGGSDFILRKWLREAAALIYPSTYEGFGLPPLEAMAEGCPVVVSDQGSIPEIVGDAGIYFNPYQLKSISNAIEQVVFDPDKTAELVMRGFDRVKKFTWTKCAEETLTIYEKIGNHRS